MLAAEAPPEEEKLNNQQAASLLKQKQCTAAAAMAACADSVAPLGGSKIPNNRNIYQPWETQKTSALSKIHVYDDDVVESKI